MSVSFPFVIPSILFIFLFQVYPTVVRSLGLGSGSAMARIGAMLTPFVAQVNNKSFLL